MGGAGPDAAVRGLVDLGRTKRHPYNAAGNIMAATEPRRRSNTWKWVFALFFLLALGGAVVMIWFNLHQQLTPEKLDANRQLWAANGPPDYVLKYSIQRNQENP